MWSATLRWQPRLRQAEEIRGSYAGQQVDLAGAGDLQVMADPDRTMQVLANLIDNAAKYSPEGRPIRVSWASWAWR